MRNILFYLVITLSAFTLTVVSAFYQRPSSEVVEYGSECKIEHWMHCYKPRKSAGFPFAFGFDTPGVSVQHSVTPLVEDEFRLLPFLINIWFYFIMLLATLRLFNKT